MRNRGQPHDLNAGEISIHIGRPCCLPVYSRVAPQDQGPWEDICDNGTMPFKSGMSLQGGIPSGDGRACYK